MTACINIIRISVDEKVKFTDRVKTFTREELTKVNKWIDGRNSTKELPSCICRIGSEESTNSRGFFRQNHIRHTSKVCFLYSTLTTDEPLSKKPKIK